MKWGIVVAAVVSVLLAPGIACASSGEALVWEETRQEIPNGGEISLWEQFNLQGGAVPQCQAEVPATLVTNGQSTDNVSGPASPSWSECGSVTVTGGFTSVEFDPQKVTATAVPAISIAEPSGCVYSVGKVEGTYSPVGPQEEAVWQTVGNATLSRGTRCSAELHLEGDIELFPRGAGSPLPWRSLEAIEKEKTEKESKEKVAREEAEAKEKATRKEKERHEIESGTASLKKVLFPTGKAARTKTLLARGWSVAFTAPWMGELVLDWYQVPKAAHLSSEPRPVLVASGRASFTTGRSHKITIRLTSKGRRLLKKAKSVNLTAKGAFLSFSKPALTVQKTFVLRR